METTRKKIIRSHLGNSFVLTEEKHLKQFHKSHKIQFEFQNEKRSQWVKSWAIIAEKMQDKFHRIYIEDLNPRIMVGGHNKPAISLGEIVWLLEKEIHSLFDFYSS